MSSTTTHPSSAPGKSTPTIYWGTGNLSSFTGASPAATAGSPEAVLEALQLLRLHGLTHLDTAQRYGNGKAEDVLGQALALFSTSNSSQKDDDKDGFKFTIDTKWAVPTDTAMDPSTIIPSAEQSNRYLTTTTSTTSTTSTHVEISATKPIHTFYLHSAPHPTSSLPTLLSAINQTHQAGLFTHFGLSNFPATLVSQTHAHCKANDYVLPTVYQGMYNAVHRGPETELFPLLRGLDMAFVAYSPIAGGFLTKTRAEFEGTDAAADGSGRFSARHAGTEVGRYRDTYVTERMLAGLESWAGLAGSEGLERAELAYRWVMFHSGLDGSRGDGVVLGARGSLQLGETLDWIRKGPLRAEVVDAVDRIWEGLMDVV